jgi:hypothetical protein
LPTPPAIPGRAKFRLQQEPPSRRSTRQLRDREAEVTAPNWTIGAFSAAAGPPLTKARNRRSVSCGSGLGHLRDPSNTNADM